MSHVSHSIRPLSRLRRHLVLGLAFACMPGLVSAATDKPLKLGTTAAFVPALEVAVAEAAKQGVKVEIIEFSDWNTPNIAVEKGDIDVNYFQHVPFLENVNRDAGFKLEAVAPGVINNVGLYSKRYASIAALPAGARVAIPGDAVNGARALLLLEKAGLVRLKPTAGHRATQADIVENPKRIRILEIEGVQLARALDDVDLAFGMPIYLRLAKTIDPNKALIFDGQDRKIYAIQFVTRADRRNDERLRKFVQIYQTSPQVRAALDRTTGKLWTPGWER